MSARRGSSPACPRGRVGRPAGPGSRCLPGCLDRSCDGLPDEIGQLCRLVVIEDEQDRRVELAEGVGEPEDQGGLVLALNGQPRSRDDHATGYRELVSDELPWRVLLVG